MYRLWTPVYGLLVAMGYKSPETDSKLGGADSEGNNRLLDVCNLSAIPLNKQKAGIIYTVWSLSA